MVPGVVGTGTGTVSTVIGHQKYDDDDENEEQPVEAQDQ